jgi:hypothetical protein
MARAKAALEGEKRTVDFLNHGVLPALVAETKPLLMPLSADVVILDFIP